MKLDRTAVGRGKYSLIKNRAIEALAKANNGILPGDVQEAMMVLKREGILDVGDSPSTEFFVMRLKDRFAGPALNTYSQHAAAVDIEYAGEVARLAKRAGMAHPNCKNPD